MGKLLWEELTYKEKNLNSTSTLRSRTSLGHVFIQQDAGRVHKCLEEERETKNPCGLWHAFYLCVGVPCELLRERKPTEPQSMQKGFDVDKLKPHGP